MTKVYVIAHVLMQITTLKAENAQLKAENAQLTELVAALRADRDQLTGVISQFESRHDSADPSDENVRLRQELQAANDAVVRDDC